MSGQGQGVRDKGSSVGRERTIIEASVLLVTLLFVIAQIGEVVAKLGPILFMMAFFFVVAVVAATFLMMLGPLPDPLGSVLRMVETMSFCVGLAGLLSLFWEMSGLGSGLVAIFVWVVSFSSTIALIQYYGERKKAVRGHS